MKVHLDLAFNKGILKKKVLQKNKIKNSKDIPI